MSNSDQNEPNSHSGFSESWLSLREPADHAARDRELTDQVAMWSAKRSSLHIVELGAGTGSNLRYLIPLLGKDQHWQVLDNDPALIHKLPQLLRPWAAKLGATLNEKNTVVTIKHNEFTATINCDVVDLAHEPESIATDGTDLITASALLDLASAQWLNKLANLITARNCACLFTLNYNGRIQWQPNNEDDDAISALLNQHQLTDKGFGKAAGPEAGKYLVSALEQNNRHVVTADSDWCIAPENELLQQAILDGWESAAIEQDSAKATLIKQWSAIRSQAIKTRTSSLTVGHIDVLSLV